jgi:ribosomal protein S18 acetylase RimI-like enzyme
MHVLDNPVWHALSGPHATVAEHFGLAARYVPDVAVFAALPDEVGPDAWDSLRELVGPAGNAILAFRDVAVPDSWAVQFVMPCRQMWLRGDLAESQPGAPAQSFEQLGAADVSEMLDLVKRTRPGPFVTRTVELGTYLGVRGERKELVSMAGERLHPPGFIEISGVCTDDAHRGRGLASQLVRTLVRGIRDRDETPILHLTIENDAAHRVYSDLGFETRRTVDVFSLQAPT